MRALAMVPAKDFKDRVSLTFLLNRIQVFFSLSYALSKLIMKKNKVLHSIHINLNHFFLMLLFCYQFDDSHMFNNKDAHMSVWYNKIGFKISYPGLNVLSSTTPPLSFSDFAAIFYEHFSQVVFNKSLSQKTIISLFPGFHDGVLVRSIKISSN